MPAKKKYTAAQLKKLRQRNMAKARAALKAKRTAAALAATQTPMVALPMPNRETNPLLTTPPIQSTANVANELTLKVDGQTVGLFMRQAWSGLGPLSFARLTPTEARDLASRLTNIAELIESGGIMRLGYKPGDRAFKSEATDPGRQ
jgi:hypothetical protein